MTFHDRSLPTVRTRINKKIARRRSLLQGAFSLSLFPPPLQIELGSLKDDWEAVGADIRRSTDSIEICD